MPPPPPASDPLPESLLQPAIKHLAKGGEREFLLEWGIAQTKSLDEVNCRLYEIRLLNNPDSLEPLPKECKSESTTEEVTEELK